MEEKREQWKEFVRSTSLYNGERYKVKNTVLFTPSVYFLLNSNITELYIVIDIIIIAITVKVYQLYHDYHR